MSLGEYFIVVGYKIVGWDMECGCSDRSGCLGFCWKTRSGFALIYQIYVATITEFA